MSDLQPAAVSASAPPFGSWASRFSAPPAVGLPLVRATFRTRQLEDPAHLVRTAGVVCHFGESVAGAAAEHIAVPQHPHAVPANCARGKVAVVMRQDGQCRAACYQVSDCQTQAALAACGNTTAAACALEAWLTGAGSAATWVELADQTSIRVQTEFSVGPAASYVVRQTWHDVPLHLCEERLLSGRYCAAWLGPLNNYLVVRARAGEDPAEFTLAEATHLWRCFGLDRQPLLARLAVVDPATQPCPRVKFFTCGEREHPSAPLTGLAVLALAAQRQNWRQLALCQRVITPAGPMTLPTVQAARDREVTIEFPPVRVEQNCHWTFTPEQRHGWR